jgi:hypothetical protein
MQNLASSFSFAPHPLQNFAPSATCLPQTVQNFAPSFNSDPHCVQNMVLSPFNRLETRCYIQNSTDKSKNKQMDNRQNKKTADE